jgi:hypothetical protein
MWVRCCMLRLLTQGNALTGTGMMILVDGGSWTSVGATAAEEPSNRRRAGLTWKVHTLPDVVSWCAAVSLSESPRHQLSGLFFLFCSDGSDLRFCGCSANSALAWLEQHPSLPVNAPSLVFSSSSSASYSARPPLFTQLLLYIRAHLQFPESSLCHSLHSYNRTRHCLLLRFSRRDPSLLDHACHPKCVRSRVEP